jgi:hypothetical protein
MITKGQKYLTNNDFTSKNPTADLYSTGKGARQKRR